MTAVRMYTTQVCPYCLRAKALLKQRGVDLIDEVRIDLDPAQREHMIALTGRRTVFSEAAVETNQPPEDSQQLPPSQPLPDTPLPLKENDPASPVGGPVATDGSKIPPAGLA